MLSWNDESPAENDIMEFGDKLKEVIADARKFKSEHSLSMKAEMDSIAINTDERFAGLFERTIPDIRACCNAREVRLVL
jgi:valyl-tRNA synthetase